MTLLLQEWIDRIAPEDRKRLAYALRFDAGPREFMELMEELRKSYEFIPAEPSEESK